MKSEQIVIEAPMSFIGSTKRLWRLSENVVIRLLVLLPLIFMVWMVVACWYALFGLLLVPYRLIRRGQRKRKLDEARHRELLAAVKR